jgi:hypothetical protein
VAFISKSFVGATTVHHGHMPEITLTGPDTATGTWALDDYSKLPGHGSPSLFHGQGHYHEEYVRTGAGWRISRSILTFQNVDD